MIMRYLFFILLPVLSFSQKYDPQKIEHGKRGNEYRVWIYFTDKDGSEPVTVSSKTIERRNKNDVLSTLGSPSIKIKDVDDVWIYLVSIKDSYLILINT